ncbi:glycosyltransferase [Rhodopirellula sp. SWK7]|uniref:glycosyltransferase n=1 Tax=Rhodopirellula sp. SWK7 TaxID=595460 RepID=UPI001F2F3BF9|nr:glycosyltransferase [Rhodopirellula sp. SWK7]
MKLVIVSHACALPQNQHMFSLAAKKRDWHVTMVLPQRWKNEYGKFMDAELYPSFSANLISAPVINNGSVPLHAYRMRAGALLRKLSPDVVFAHNEAYALSTIQWCRAAKQNGDIPFGFFSCQNLVKRYPIPFRQSESWVYRNSKFFLPITNAVDEVHREKGYCGPSSILPLGFDPDQYHATESIMKRHRDASSRTFRFAFVGRVVEEKGLVNLAAALGKIADLDWQLIMIGAGPYEPEVKAAFEKHHVAERVEWRGFVPHHEVARFFESVDCLLLPSETRANWKEQFGRVLVESMACGTPVVGSDSGEIPTIIQKTGGGIAFREANPESCAEALRRMISDTDARCEMAESGHAYVHKKYALPVLADQFATAVESVVK